MEVVTEIYTIKLNLLGTQHQQKCYLSLTLISFLHYVNLLLTEDFYKLFLQLCSLPAIITASNVLLKILAAMMSYCKPAFPLSESE